MEIRSPKNKEEWDQYFGLRYEVMSKPSGYPKNTVHEEKDSESFHVAAFNNNEIIGVGRLHYDDNDLSVGYVRFMAVAVDQRSKGIGSAVLSEIEKIAKTNGSKKIKLKARETAIKFYEKNGYEVVDKCTEKFFKTPHWNMVKQID